MNAIKSVVMGSTADDLDGVARDASPDIGCYEYSAGAEPFSCLAGFAPARLFKDQPVTLTSSLVNPPADGVVARVFSINSANAVVRSQTIAGGRSPGYWVNGMGVDIGCYECQEVMGLQMLVR